MKKGPTGLLSPFFIGLTYPDTIPYRFGRGNKDKYEARDTLRHGRGDCIAL